jgi:2-hydroxy-3-keto-5-methylthiopentenyl-1-phosphate phosphatase
MFKNWRIGMSEYVFLFDLDATITKVEILPEISAEIGKDKEMRELTERAMRGEIPFERSFRERVSILQDTAIPAMENCITTISNIEVATDEVKALKDSYLQSVQKECEAMKMVVSAIDGENADYLTQADSLIAEAATLRSDYQTKLQAIANEQGIVVNQ